MTLPTSSGPADGAAQPAKAALPKTSARIPFDPSYPAHIKVLLSSLARSVGAAQGTVFSECLHACLDYLIRYWLGANLGGLKALGKSPVAVPETAPSLPEAVRLLRHSVFSWESMPDQPMRQLLRLGFFEPTSPPQPRLHTRWLGLAGDPMTEGIGAADLLRWESLGDHVMSHRVAYLQVLSSFLSASRPLFIKYQRSYLMEGDTLALQISYESKGPHFTVAPPLPWEKFGQRMSLAQIVAVEKSTTLPVGPARPSGSGEGARVEVKRTSMETPPASAEPAVAPEPQPEPEPEFSRGPELQPLVLASQAPPQWIQLLAPLNGHLSHWSPPRRRPEPSHEAWEDNMQQLAVQMVNVLSDVVGVFAAVLLGQLRRRGPLPEPLEAALRSFGELEQRLKLLHFGWQADDAPPELRALFVDEHGLPLTHARWLGLPDNLLQGLGRLSFWVRLARRELAHLGWEEAQQQMAEVWLCLSSALQALTPLWGDGTQSASWSRREDGCLSGQVWLGKDWISLEEGLPEETLPELTPREMRALSEVIQDLQLLQQRGNAPYFIVEEVCEFVSTPGSGSGMVLWGPEGAGKSFLLTHLLEEQRQLLSPISGTTSCDCSWIYCDDSRDFLLESLNEAVGFHQWRGDCDWSPLAPPALADLYRCSDRLQSGDSDESSPSPPLKAFLHSLWSRNQPRSSTQKMAFLLDGLRDDEARPWSETAMPIHFSWIAATDDEPPAGWSTVYPPARLPIPVQDSTYKRFLAEHLSSVFGGDRERWNAVSARALALADARLWAGLLNRGLVRKLEQLPPPSSLFPFLLKRLRLSEEQKHFLVFLSEGPPLPTSLIEPAGFDEQEVSALIDLFPWLFLLREEVVGRVQEDWEERLSFLTLAHPSYAVALRRYLGIDSRVVVGKVVEHLAALIDRKGPRQAEWPPGLDFLAFLSWARLADSQALGWKLLSVEGLRKRREAVCARFEEQRRPHRKVLVLGSWIDFLDSLEMAECPLGLETILADILLEERLWAFSSRALTYRSMGRLEEALRDIDHSISEFRKAVPENSSLLNGLAAAHNRRSEILREQGRFNEALPDAHEAVAAYEQVLAQSDRSHLEPLLALALHNRGVVLQELGLLEQGEADMERALERYRPWQEKLNARVRLDLARALRERGRLALLREDPVQSRDDSMRVLQLLERFGEDSAELRVERAQAQHQLAEAFLAIDEETRALEASDRAAEIWEVLVQEGRLDLRAIFAQELNHRAQLLLHLGKVDEAAAAVQAAADLHTQLVELEGRHDLHEHLSRSLLLRGRVWQRGGKWEAAKQDYTAACRYLSLPGPQGMGLRRQTRDALVETGVYLAGLHFQLADYESAITQAEATLSLLEGEVSASVPTLEKKARLLDLLGRSLIHHGGGQPVDQEAALGAHDKAVDLLSELVDVQGHYHLLPRLAEAYLGRARTRRHLGQEQPAVEDANMAVELLSFLSEKGGDPGVLALLGPARLEAAELLWSLGQSERAFEHIQDAVSDFELYGEESQGPALHMASPLLLRGKLHLEAGRVTPALEDFEAALAGLRDLQQRGWDVETQIGECLLLKAQAAMTSERPDEVANDVLEAIGGGSSMADSWESFEKLLQRVHAEARAHLGQAQFEEARVSYTQLLELIKKAEACASLAELQPYRIRTYQERALVRLQQGFNAEASFDWNEAGSDLTLALQLAALSAAGRAREDLFLLAQVYETRAQYFLQQGREGALVDLGRAIEALLEIDPSDALVQAKLIALYEKRRQLSGELGDHAGEWRDLCQLRSLLRSSISLGEGENLRTLISAVYRRSQLLETMDLLQPAQEEAKECLRLLSKLQQQSQGSEAEALTRQMVLIHLHLGTPQGNHSWEQASFDLVNHLCEAVELVYKSLEPESAWSWIPLEQLYGALDHGAALSTVKLAHSLLRVFAQREGSEAWGDILSQTLKHTSWDDIPPTLASAFFQRWASWAGLVSDRWVGDAFRVLAGLSLRRLKESPEASEALRQCLDTWCALPSHQLALMGVPQERLTSLTAALGASAV